MAGTVDYTRRWARVGILTLAIGSFSLGSVGVEEPPTTPAPEKAAAARDPGTCSSSSTLLAPGEDPCPLLAQAHGILGKLHPSASNYVKSISCEFNLEGNLGIQQELLREDLVWQQKGFEPRQLDALVFVSVALAFEDAEHLLQELDQRLEQKADAHLEARRERVSLFRTQAFALLQEFSARLKDVSDSELQFRF